MRTSDPQVAMERFLPKVDKTDTCWLWTACTDALGYGRINALGENKAHRLSYRLYRGDIPTGMKILHSCDVRNCVNPDHLRIGTQAENVRDSVERGRWRGGDVRGVKNPMARLTPAAVAEIRRSVAGGTPQIEMARRFSVSPMTISRAVRRETWA